MALGPIGEEDREGRPDSGEVLRRRRGGGGQGARRSYGAPDGGVGREDWRPGDSRRRRDRGGGVGERQWQGSGEGQAELRG